MSELASEPGNNVSELASEPGNNVSELASEPGNNVSELASEPGNNVSELASEPGNNVSELASEPGNNVSELASEPGNNVSELASEPGNIVSELASEPAAEPVAEPARPLLAGERVLLTDNRGRRYLVTLEPGAEFHSHAGIVHHDRLIGSEEGIQVLSTRNARYTVLRPTLADFVLKMPRGAQVIYPKDLGPILVLADVFPGARVLESGVGSGALSATLLRAGADVVGYELRDDFAAKAVENVSGFLGEGIADRYRVEIRDCYEGLDETGLDRIVLDLPEPWRVVGPATSALRSGGVLVAYTPSIVQAVRLRETLQRSPFGLAETIEVLQRTWHIEGPSVRPDHRMVAHTGFLTHTRLLRP